METKYQDVIFQTEDVKSDIKRLINQIWKLIPMKENNEDWKKQASQVLIELTGLQNIFVNKIDLLIILSKLEGLLEIDEIDFADYRSAIFSTLSLLSEINERLI